MPLPAVLDGAGIVHAGLVDMFFVAITAKLAMAKHYGRHKHYMKAWSF